MNTGTSRKRKFTFFLNRLKDKPKVKNKAQSMLKEVLIRTAILKIRQFSFFIILKSLNPTYHLLYPLQRILNVGRRFVPA